MTVIPPYTSHTYKITYRWSDMVGDFGSRIWWAADTGHDDPEDYTPFAHNIYDSFTDQLLPYMGSERTLESVTVTSWVTADGAVGEWAAPETGTLGGAALPSSACFDIGFRVPVRYRGGKPRIYLPLGTTSSLENSRTWAAGDVVTWVEAWEGHINDIESVTNDTFGGGNHRCILKGDGSYLPQYEPTEYVGRATVGSQRRRLTTRL